MTHTSYDLTILGAGSGGLTAARLAAALGARILLIDKERLGGDCLHFGCVPSKSLLHVARVAQQMRRASQLGIFPTQGDPLRIDVGVVSHSIQEIIGHVAEQERRSISSVPVTFGAVSFVSPHELLVNDEHITSRKFLIATGSHPLVPRIEGLEETGYLTNEHVFDLHHLPASLIVLGGGPIGVELGQAFAHLGTQVTLLEGLERVLPREDPEMSEVLTSALQAEQMTIVTRAQVVKAEAHGQHKVVTARQGDQLVTFEAEEILVALGRRPNVEGLHLEAAGVRFDAQGIKVNASLQTSTPSILAIGDVLGGYLLTHVAAYQAGIAVRNALVPLFKKKVDERVVPWCTFTDPEVARIGLTPEEARKQYRDIRIVSLPWAHIDRAQAEQETAGLLKIVLAGKQEDIVGVHLIGAHAGELLGELSLAMRHRLRLSDVLATIHAYPTLQTGIQQLAFEAYLAGSAARRDRRIVQTMLRWRR